MREKIKYYRKVFNLLLVKYRIEKMYFQFVLLIFILLPFARNNKFQWLATFFSVFSVLSNDSIQATGTYLSSHQNDRWYKIFIMFASVFIIGILFSWLFFDRGISFGVLSRVPYTGKINIFYIVAPLLLLILNGKGIPASSTFLIISLFISSNNIISMLNKTLMSYFLSLVVSFYIWFFVIKKYKKILHRDDNEEVETMWLKTQKITTIFLTLAWLCLTLANMGVFLPRKLSFQEMLYFVLIVLGSLAIILMNRGGKLQEIMNQKQDSKNIKISTITNLIFSLILFVSKVLSDIPISTTFVLLAILAGKELATTYTSDILFGKKYKDCFIGVVKDLNKGILGIVISLTFMKIINMLHFI